MAGHLTLPDDHPYKGRFLMVTGALIGIGLAIAVVTVLALVGGVDRRGDGLHYSKWHPKGTDGADAIMQIADHVSGAYREAGGPLVNVSVGPLELPVAVRTAPNAGAQVAKDAVGVVYTMKGLGDGGFIDVGKPTDQRKLLLRREALELSLLTFRYVTDINEVMVILPPPPPPKGVTKVTGDYTEAVFFRPGDLRDALTHPLARTLSEDPIEPSTFVGAETARVRGLTHDNLFEAQAKTDQGGQSTLVLVPLKSDD